MTSQAWCRPFAKGAVQQVGNVRLSRKWSVSCRLPNPLATLVPSTLLQPFPLPGAQWSRLALVPGILPLFLPISLAKGQDHPSSQRTSVSFSGRPLVSLVCFIYLRLCHFLPPVGFGFRLPFLSSFLQVSSRVVDLGPSPMRPLQLSLPAPSARIPQVSAGRVLRPGAFHLLLSPTARLSACGLLSTGSVTALGRKGHREAFLGGWTLLGVWLKWDSLGTLRGAR